ncbi:MAG: hypothetical protein DCF25_08725 [Leptolyngbya foveolarum]|uniref:Fungal lipase-type domain-containing protein n=1 Tax=Leptolyngbya foveolarum TaxID=47253 RepID=A0A2W4UJL1_9CYAN|nr:MAG: hypothetical protein DCF25_08725 [Leptolyngbya foveolarum]
MGSLGALILICGLAVEQGVFWKGMRFLLCLGSASAAVWLGSFSDGSFNLFSPDTYEASAIPAAGAEWLLGLGGLLGGSALALGVLYYVRQQRWQRTEFLRRVVREFEQDAEVWNALKILDFEEYRDYNIPAQGQEEPVCFRVSDRLLCNALASHDQRARQKQRLEYSQDRDELDLEALRQYRIETTLRDWFNAMLNGFEHFGYLIESGLFSAEELRPWLNYWIQLIGNPAYRRPGASGFYDALYSYIHHSGFFGVQKLFEQFGYRILPSPYQETDLLDVSLASKPNYNTQLALTLAKASLLAYQDKQFVAQVVGRWSLALRQRSATDLVAVGVPEAVTAQTIDQRSQRVKNTFIRHNFRYFNNQGRDTQAYIFRTSQFMVLAFRGSQELKDWLTNFTTQLRDLTIRKNGVTSISSYHGRVHAGFFLAWAIIEQSVLAQISRWQLEAAEKGGTLPPLYITGHSLGGALATIAAAALSDNGVDVAGVYTFGQPRVGDRLFVRQLNEHVNGRVFRFVNNNDIVPHVPPPFSMWNPTRLYGHVGIVKYFNAKGEIIPNYTLLARAIDNILGLGKVFSGNGFDQISDHRMEYYISHLETALKEEIEAYASQMLDVGD